MARGFPFLRLSHAAQFARDKPWRAAYVPRRMGAVRTFLRDHRALAMAIIAIALCMKALVPAGYMFGGGSGGMLLSVQLCSEGGGPQSITIAVPGTGGDEKGQSGHNGHGDPPCPYSALSMAADTGADAPMLAAALLFIIAIGFAPIVAVHLQRLPRLRPPLRGPPILS